MSEGAATSLREYWPRRYTVVVLAFLAVFICYMDRVNISVAIIPMAKDLGWDPATQGVVLSSFFVGYLATQILGGRLSDRFGGKVIEVPSGFSHDSASVPRLPVCWWLAGDTAHAAAVIHDFLYAERGVITESKRIDRRTADAVFLEAMRCSEVPGWRARVMWLAVRLFGGRAWH